MQVLSRRSQEADVPVLGPLVRLLSWIGLACAGALVVIGGLGLRVPGLVAVVVAGLLAACMAIGIAPVSSRSGRRSVLEPAIQAAGWTVGVLLALVGVAALAGGVVALLAGAAGATTWVLIRAARPGATAAWAAPPSAPTWRGGIEVLLLPVPPPEEGGPSAPVDRTSSVSMLSTPALGREWIRTAASLKGPLAPADRAALVRRRQQTLDELERRDPAGFARWLAAGPALSSDPAAYVHGHPAQGDPAAGTDA
jgi:hypothetical protein